MLPQNEIIVYTDGSCLKNPGKGAWAAVIVEGKSQIELSGSFRKTTNNRMEYLAAIKALEFLQTRSETIIIHTDSKLLYDTMTSWIFSWRKKGWKKSDGKEVMNIDLVIRLDELSRNMNVKWQKVAAHKGIELNERCDEIANSAASTGTDIDYIFEKIPIPANAPSNDFANTISRVRQEPNIFASTSAAKVAVPIILENQSNKTGLLKNSNVNINIIKKDNKLHLELTSNNNSFSSEIICIDNLPDFIFTILKKYDE